MKIFITGATGFVGSHLCDRLNKEGHELFILVRNKDKLEQFNVPGNVISGSLSDSSFVDLLPIDLDLVIHTAGIVHHFNSQEFFKINFHYTKEMIEKLKLKYQYLKFLFVSSLSVAGPTTFGKQLDEDSSGRPVSDYGRSKQQAEDYLKKNCQNWDYTIIRPPMIIGPRDQAVLDVFQMISKGIVPCVGTKGMDKEYSFICVHDLINITSEIINQNKFENEIYFTSFGDITYGQLLNSISDEAKKKLSVIKIPLVIIFCISNILGFLNKFMNIEARLTPDKFNELAPDAWLCSGEKISKALDYTYVWSLEKTIKDTFNDYRNRGWLD